MKAYIIAPLAIALIVFAIAVGTKYFNKRLANYNNLREDHLAIMSAQSDTAKLMCEQHAELNRKLDLLLNIATNHSDGIRLTP